MSNTFDPYDDGECPICGGEGFVFECFDGCCEDAEIGCDDCMSRCECNRKQSASPELQEILRDALKTAAASAEGMESGATE